MNTHASLLPFWGVAVLPQIACIKAHRTQFAYYINNTKNTNHPVRSHSIIVIVTNITRLRVCSYLLTIFIISHI